MSILIGTVVGLVVGFILQAIVDYYTDPTRGKDKLHYPLLAPVPEPELPKLYTSYLVDSDEYKEPPWSPYYQDDGKPRDELVETFVQYSFNPSTFNIDKKFKFYYRVYYRDYGAERERKRKLKSNHSKS